MTQSTLHLHTLVRISPEKLKDLRTAPSSDTYDLLLTLLSARVNGTEVLARLEGGSPIEIHALFRIDQPQCLNKKKSQPQS